MQQITCDVVILGAGVAGLAAAKRLCTERVSLAVVEARDRAGGRISTLHPADWPVPVELGAEFIHGRPEELWAAVHAADLPVSAVPDNHWQAPDESERPVEFEKLWSTIINRLESATKDGDLPFTVFLERDCPELTPEEIAEVTAYVEGFNAADSRLISCRWLLQSERKVGPAANAESFRIPTGYDGVVRWLESGMPRDALRLNTIVSTIRWQRRHVDIESVAANGTPLPPIRAKAAVITLPLAVLRAPDDAESRRVRFLPELEEKWRAVDKLMVGSVIKLLLRFRRPFWQELDVGEAAFFHGPHEAFPTWWTTSPTPSTILIGWAGGPAADKLAGRESPEILAQGLDALARIFRLDREMIAGLLEAWYVADWHSDPYARGAYTYVAVGGIDAPHRLAEPVEDTLFFAGEATHAEMGGTVAGALASGYRAAEEVLDALK
jgi:monoamine oxidase